MFDFNKEADDIAHDFASGPCDADLAKAIKALVALAAATKRTEIAAQIYQRAENCRKSAVVKKRDFYAECADLLEGLADDVRDGKR